MNTLADLSRQLAERKVTSRELVERSLALIADPSGEGARIFTAVDAAGAREERGEQTDGAGAHDEQALARLELRGEHRAHGVARRLHQGTLRVINTVRQGEQR